MAAAQSLVLQQRTIYKVENHLYHHPPKFRSHTFSYVNTKNIRTKSFSNLISVKPLSLNSNNNVVSVARRSSTNDDSNQDINKFGFPKLESKQNPIEIAAETLIKALRPLLKTAVTVVLGVVLMMLYNPNNSAMAATSYSSYSSSSSTSPPTPVSSSTETSGCGVLFCVFLFIVLFGWACQGISSSISEASVSVMKLQVGLSGLGRSLQKDFKTTAKPVDKSTSQGLHYILTELVVALLRCQENCISASLSIDVEWCSKRATRRFDQLSLEERSKFDEEILVNVNSMRKQNSTTAQSSGVGNEHMVLTILVMVQGKLKCPRINNVRELKDVLQKLGCLPHDRILRIRVLWTPEVEEDNLSEEGLLENYPLLRPLQ